MYYELALISVVVAGAYWGWYVLSKQPNGTLTFGIMQLVAATLSGIGLYAHRTDGARWMGVAGAIGLGTGACLLLIGPLVRALARRFASAERLGIAGRLLDIADLLAPGSGVADEKAVISAMKEIRDGHIEHTVDALTAAKHTAPLDARLAIDERIAMLYLAAYRWSEAITYAEEHLFGAIPEEPPPAPAPLRRALGFAPPVWVELLGAYGRTGDLDRAAQMLTRLEDVCEGREDAGVWIHRARLMFLALAGRPAAVKVLLEPPRARHMSAGARTYWLAVAHEHEGDRAAATAAYERARARSRGRPRELIDRALENLAKADGLPGVRLSDGANEVALRVEAAPVPSSIAPPTPPRPWATYILTFALLAVAGTIALVVGSTRDLGVLTRAGALVRGFVDGGEWWRVFSCIFVHVGFMHLLVNVVGTWFVARIAEELFGTSRTLSIYIVSGFAGAVASYLSSPVGMSAGASGALFGLLGAVFVELTWHRTRYRSAWQRGIWGGLAIVIVAQIGYGFFYPVIDQWAHGAGLVAGTVLGAALSPHAPWARAARQFGRVLAVLAITFVVVAAVRVVREPVEDSLSRQPRIRHNVNGVQIAAPALWSNHGELAEPDGLVIIWAQRTVAHDANAQIAMFVADTAIEIAKAHHFEEISPATSRVVTLPANWSGAEVVGSFVDPMGYKQHLRMVAAGVEIKGELVLVAVMTPDSIARMAPNYLARLLSSVRLP
ncbi:MAG: rhomboid family intramembrane serine protease [Kofleriaceae bacterium]